MLYIFRKSSEKYSIVCVCAQSPEMLKSGAFCGRNVYVLFEPSVVNVMYKQKLRLGVHIIIDQNIIINTRKTGGNRHIFAMSIPQQI